MDVYVLLAHNQILGGKDKWEKGCKSSEDQNKEQPKNHRTRIAECNTSKEY